MQLLSEGSNFLIHFKTLTKLSANNQQVKKQHIPYVCFSSTKDLPRSKKEQEKMHQAQFIQKRKEKNRMTD